jgi:thiol-disulfide isomerase/thioredoxin
MRQLLWLAIFFPLIMQAQSVGVKWTEGLSWEQIKTKAKSEGKYIFVDCYATWCGPCKLMDKNVYINDSVGEKLNENFISVKVQMDETPEDGDPIKSWYRDARAINDMYKPEGYPCYLFLSPNGVLVHRDVGYKNVADFMAVVQEALTDPVKRYRMQAFMFKEKKLEYTKMPALANLAKEQKDLELYKEIIKIYKENYLDHLPEAKAYTKESLTLIALNANQILDSKDRFFQFFYKKSEEANAIMNNPNLYQLSEFVVKKIIIKEEIINKLYVNGKPITNLTPDWARIRSSIESKYKKLVGVDEMILNEQFFYYLETKNWNKHINCFVERVEKYGMRWLGIAPTNVIASSFKHCHDSALLSKAINWANPVILKSISDFAWRELIEKSGSGIGLPWNNDFTNYAVLLYNLGKKQEAINGLNYILKR